MGAVYKEFQRKMARVRERFEQQPRRELVHLLLLALEREEIVSISYRESVILRRLASMPIDDAVCELIRHALVWIWKDDAVGRVSSALRHWGGLYDTAPDGMVGMMGCQRPGGCTRGGMPWPWTWSPRATSELAPLMNRASSARPAIGLAAAVIL